MGHIITFNTTGFRFEETDEDGVHVIMKRRHRLVRLVEWTPLDGVVTEPIDAPLGEDDLRHADLVPPHGMYRLEDPRALSGAHNHTFAVSEDGIHTASADAITDLLKQRASVTFGDVRSLVAQASDARLLEDRAEELVGLWRGVLRTIHHLRSEGEQHMASEYTIDHLDKFLERMGLVDLHGTPRQRKWAKDLRLRTLQRLGLLTRDAADGIAACAAMVAEVRARTLPHAADWIEARQIIYDEPPASLTRWLQRM